MSLKLHNDRSDPDRLISEYFKLEVKRVTVPPFPLVRTDREAVARARRHVAHGAGRRAAANLAFAALFAGCLSIIILNLGQPSTLAQQITPRAAHYRLEQVIPTALESARIFLSTGLSGGY